MKEIRKLLQRAANIFGTSGSSRLMSGKVQIKLFPGPAKGSLQGKEEEKLKVGKTIAVDTLVKLLSIPRFTAIDLVSKASRLCLLSADSMKTNYNLLNKHNIKQSILFQHPELLGVQNIDDMHDNIETIKKLPYDLNDTIYLSILERKVLQKVVNKMDFLEKIDLLVRKLETSVNVIVEGFVKRPFLLATSVKRLEEVIDLLKKNKITGSDILKDWWVLQYSPKLIQERIDLASENHIDPFKTWMVRCTLDILDRYVQRRTENKLVLGDNTLVEYLAARLQCSSEEAKGLMSKQPALQKKSVKKMKEIIDFLYADGFKPYHICRVPKILLHSAQTTRKRIRELEKQGVHMDSLHMITKSQKQYMQYYQALVKSNLIKIKTKNAKD